MKRQKKAAFASEAALCAEFIKNATADGKWTPYGETGGFDILLVRKADGFQIGIEAKLTLNTAVVVQALPSTYYNHGAVGPDCRAVLVPCGGVQSGLDTICHRLGITVIRQEEPEEDRRPYWRGNAFNPRLPDLKDFWMVDREWHEWCPVKRLKLPDYVPDSGAGHSAPIKLTEWKIKAIKLAIVLEERPVTRLDFKALQIDASRWTDKHTGWLDQSPDGYVASPRIPDFKTQHPTVYAQIKADSEKWMPALAQGLKLVKQEVMAL